MGGKNINFDFALRRKKKKSLFNFFVSFFWHTPLILHGRNFQEQNFVCPVRLSHGICMKKCFPKPIILVNNLKTNCIIYDCPTCQPHHRVRNRAFYEFLQTLLKNNFSFYASAKNDKNDLLPNKKWSIFEKKSPSGKLLSCTKRIFLKIKFTWVTYRFLYDINRDKCYVDLFTLQGKKRG